MGSLLLFVSLISLLQSTTAHTEYKFGLITSNNTTCKDFDNVTMSLYWTDRLFQCHITPSQHSKEYICNTLTGDFECDATKSTINKQYALQLETLHGYGCFDEIFIHQINTTTLNITEELNINITSTMSYSNLLITFNMTSTNHSKTTTFQELPQIDQPICYPFVTIDITACDQWSYGSVSNSLQMQLKGSLGASEFFYVNKISQLPINGTTISFYIDDIENVNEIGDLYYVVISVDDSWGYCVKNITVKLSDNYYPFSAESYFGSGIILSNKCPYSYQYISSDYPLISCIDDFLELDAYALRGIYTLDIHTCITQKSGMTIKNMKDNMYTILMGKRYNEFSYSTTSVTFLDHFQPKITDMQQLGHLVAGNVIIEQSKTDSLYSVLDGTLIGIKIECVDYINKPFKETGQINIEINGVNPGILIEDIFETGRYLILFFSFESRIGILSQDTQIALYSNKNSNLIGSPVNVYLIFDGYSEEYQLPFTIYDHVDAISWENANEKCIELNGTSLVSIHSYEEQFLIAGYLSNNSAWIGAKDVTMEKLDNWKWIDGSIMDYKNWASGEPKNTNGQECSVSSIDVNGNPVWNVLNCKNPSIPQTKYICACPQWHTNTDRIFEINTAEHLADVTLVSLGNNDLKDDICIDFISINDQAAMYISSNWIGGSFSTTQSMALFKYPVCETQVVGMRVDYETSRSDYSRGDMTLAGLKCQNNGRQTSSQCTISQSYSLTKTTSYSISNSDSKTAQYSWGSSSALTLGTAQTDSETYGTSETNSESDTNSQSNTNSQSQTNSLADTNSQSTTTSNGFSWGTDQSISSKVGGSVGFFGIGASASVTTTVGANQQWSQSTSNTQGSSQTYGYSDTSGRSSTNGRSSTSGASKTASQANTESKTSSKATTDTTNKENSDASTSTSGYESSYATTETSTIVCSASIQVPPSHSIEYCLNFNAINTTIYTYTDLKLTLCSAFLNPDTVNDESNYIYIDNIPGVIEKKEMTSCDVDFSPAEYVRNDMKCSDEQQLAILSGSSYLPRCISSNTSAYDGCQCDVGLVNSIGTCWCVDSSGNKVDGKGAQLTDDMTYKQVCVEELGCEHSEVSYAVGDIFESFTYDNAVQAKSTISFVVLFSVFACIFLIIYGFNVYRKHKGVTNNDVTEKEYDVNASNYAQPLLEMN